MPWPRRRQPCRVASQSSPAASTRASSSCATPKSASPSSSARSQRPGVRRPRIDPPDPAPRPALRRGDRAPRWAPPSQAEPRPVARARVDPPRPTGCPGIAEALLHESPSPTFMLRLESGASHPGLVMRRDPSCDVTSRAPLWTRLVHRLCTPLFRCTRLAAVCRRDARERTETCGLCRAACTRVPAPRQTHTLSASAEATRSRIFVTHTGYTFVLLQTRASWGATYFIRLLLFVMIRGRNANGEARRRDYSASGRAPSLGVPVTGPAGRGSISKSLLLRTGTGPTDRYRHRYRCRCCLLLCLAALPPLSP